MSSPRRNRSAQRHALAVPENVSPGEGVVVGYDGSREAARALSAFVGIGLQVLGPVKVVSVDSNSSVAAAKTADRAVEYLSMHEITAEAEPIVSLLPPGKVILDKAHESGAQLLVLGAKGKSKFWELFFGSVTQRALEESKIPLFMYH